MKKTFTFCLALATFTLLNSQTIVKVEINDLSDGTNPPAVVGELTDLGDVTVQPEYFSLTTVTDGDMTGKRCGFLLVELDNSGNPVDTITDRSEGAAPYVIWGDSGGDYELPEAEEILVNENSYKLTTYLFPDDGSIADAIEIKEFEFSMYYDPSSVRELVKGGIFAYPVPFSSNLQVNAKKDMEYVEVYDISGRKNLGLSSIGATSVNLNTSDLAAGVYLIRVSFTDGKHELIKSVKE